jgi:SAM-dependent methyltransferase
MSRSWARRRGLQADPDAPSRSPAQRFRRYGVARADPSSMTPPRTPPMTVHAWLRYDVFRRLVPKETHSILEIGAGKGSTGSLLAREYRYVGLEPDPVSFAAAVEQVGEYGTVLNTSAESYPTDGTFDVACAFEVLEHIEDDGAAVRHWQRFVKPGGWLFVSVPAGRKRFGPTDLRQGHRRRYDRDDLGRVLTDAGLSEVTVVTYGFPIGYLLLAGSNMLARRRPHGSTLDDRTAASGRWMQPSARRAKLMRVAAVPFQVVQRPFDRTALGTGLVGWGRTPRSTS